MHATDAWLRQQAKKLKNLGAKCARLKLDFVQNAKQKGEILGEVRDRLAGTSQPFKEWVEQNTNIGYSTALLWVDVAENYEEVKDLFVTNGLEMTVRNIRDAIRDARQEKGAGKPSSGRRKVADVDQNDEGNAQKWERELAAAEAEAAITDDKTEDNTHYKVTVFVFSDGDQTTLEQALSDWSPVSKPLAAKKHAHSVTVNADLAGINKLLTRLGKTLEAARPQKVRVSIEL